MCRTGLASCRTTGSPARARPTARRDVGLLPQDATGAASHVDQPGLVLGTIQRPLWGPLFGPEGSSLRYPLTGDSGSEGDSTSSRSSTHPRSTR